MKVGMTLLVRDEVDVVKANLDYHLNNGIDTIIITDNGSVDGTYEICREYLNNGVVEIIQEPPFDFSQYAYVTKMANILSSKYGVNWIINCDADEFFVSRKYKNIKMSLLEISDEFSIVSVNRHDFIPINEDCTIFSPINFPFRKSVSLALNGNPLPPKVIHRASPNIEVTQGNHSVSGDNLYAITKDSDLEVLHYPIRSYNQFKSKVRNGGSSYEKNETLSKNIGYHKRYWYGLLLKDELRNEFDKSFHSPEKLATALLENTVINDPYLSLFEPFKLEERSE